MHNNYYLLKRLTPVLEDRIEAMELTECFSQNKNELILGFTSSDQTFYIKAHLQSDFCCLSFPEDFHRSRRNSVDLFKEVQHHKVTGVHQYLNERCFSILFENDIVLLFKMHGNRSNILLYQDGEVISVFNSQLKNDWQITLDGIDRPIDQSEGAFIESDQNYRPLFPTFGKLVNQYIYNKIEDNELELTKWEMIQATVGQLDSGGFYITGVQGKLSLSLLDVGEILESHKGPIEALNRFFHLYIKNNSFSKELSAALRPLESKIAKTKSYIQKTTNKLKQLTGEASYSQWADILMANLHRVPAHSKEVILENLYDEMKPITIKLKSSLSPQRNAEVYYRKAKNQQIELNKLIEAIDAKENQLLDLETHTESIKSIEDLKELRKYLKEHGLQQAQLEKEEAPKPYHRFEKDDFEIWVGKNAKHNDILTQKLAFKEDLWLHAKDVSGSHTIIKHQSGKAFPKHVIEYAAQLAAYYSKRKTDSLCPVIYTPKKFVRKVKGAPAGAVVVDKEQVILVKPER